MKKHLIAGFVLLSAAAHADPRDDALSAMLRCSALSERAARLGCYDATIARVPGALNQPVARPAPSAVTVPPAPPVAARANPGFADRLFGVGSKRAAQTTVAEFGSESIANGGSHAFPNPMDGDTIDRISARLIAYDFAGGYLTVTLDNGQVWRQTPGADPVGHLSRPALSFTALIERLGVSGSYAMHLSGRAGVIAVRRIR